MCGVWIINAVGTIIVESCSSRVEEEWQKLKTIDIQVLA